MTMLKRLGYDELILAAKEEGVVWEKFDVFGVTDTVEQRIDALRSKGYKIFFLVNPSQVIDDVVTKHYQDEVERLRAVIAHVIRATERDHYVSDTDAINNVVRTLRHHGFDKEVAPSAETNEG